MATMGPMIEFLLAAKRPGGGHLVKFGGMSIQIPIFPAGLSITVSSVPTVTAYASIQYYVRYSPAMVPNAFEIAVTHSGLFLDLGFIDRAMIDEGHNAWLVLTDAEPATMSLANVSGVDQSFEQEVAFLIIDTADDLIVVNDIVLSWGSSDAMLEAQNRTNDLLEQLVLTQGGTLPRPRPPLPGGA